MDDTPTTTAATGVTATLNDAVASGNAVGTALTITGHASSAKFTGAVGSAITIKAIAGANIRGTNY